MLISTELKDPRLGFVTVTRVEISSDLQVAKVYVSIIGDRHVAKQSMMALESARGFLRGSVGSAVVLRHTPELVFVEDRSTEKAIALSRVLAESRAAATPAAEVTEPAAAAEPATTPEATDDSH